MYFINNKLTISGSVYNKPKTSANQFTQESEVAYVMENIAIFARNHNAILLIFADMNFYSRCNTKKNIASNYQDYFNRDTSCKYVSEWKFLRDISKYEDLQQHIVENTSVFKKPT